MSTGSASRPRRATPIVADVSLRLAPGEALGLVGESGSGKTTTVLSLLGYTQAGARITAGEITIGGVAVEASRFVGARQLRGRQISLRAAEPRQRLEPVDAGRAGRARHAARPPSWASRRAWPKPSTGSALERAGLPGDPMFQRRYPHQLSGGQQQRVCIAVALVCEPPVVVLDEPTTGLDVVTQARILDELRRLRRDHGMAMLYVTHDLAVVAGFADRLAVMYAGRIIEDGPTAEILRRPEASLHARPADLDSRSRAPAGARADAGRGGGRRRTPARLCVRGALSLRTDACAETVPELRTVQLGHRSRCLHSTP